MLLAVLAVVFALGAPGVTPTPVPATPPKSHLPPTQPGLNRDEGVFLITTADDGGRAIYFVAQNTRHSILASDLQLELQLNALWPMRPVDPEEVLALAEGAPIGAAQTGLLKAQPTSSSLDAQPLASAAGSSDAPPAASEPSLYLLRPGDNLTRLSAQYGTSIEAILAANGLTNANRVLSGQTLLIPAAEAAADGPAQAPVERPVQAPADATVQSPAEPAPIAAAAAPPQAPVEAESMTYVVQRGDSAISIARRLGVDLEQLLATNDVKDRNRVYIGQTLTIPGA